MNLFDIFGVVEFFGCLNGYIFLFVRQVYLSRIHTGDGTVQDYPC